MTIKGYTFDKAPVPANRDSIVLDKFNFGQSTVIPQRRNGMALHTSGLKVTVDTGFAIIQGRLVEISAPETINIPTNSKGYVVITLDLSKNNPTTGTPFQYDYTFTLAQARVEFVTTLVNADTNEDNPIYTFQLASVSSNASSASVTINESAYKDLVVSNDGVLIGDDESKFKSKIIGNIWSAGGDGTGELVISPKANKQVIIKEDTTGNPAGISAGQSNFTGITSNGRQTITVNISGLTLYITESAAGVDVFATGALKTQGDYTWRVDPTKIPDTITAPPTSVGFTVPSVGGVTGKSVKVPFYVSFIINPDRTISYSAGNLINNEWSNLTPSGGFTLKASVSWFK